MCPRYSGTVTQDLQMDSVYTTWNATTAANLKVTDTLDHLWPPPRSLRAELFSTIYSSNFYPVSHGRTSLISLWRGEEQGNGPRSCTKNLFVRKEHVLMRKAEVDKWLPSVLWLCTHLGGAITAVLDKRSTWGMQRVHLWFKTHLDHTVVDLSN